MIARQARYHLAVFTDDDEVLGENTARFRRDYMDEFGAPLARVLTVLPPQR